MPDEKKKWEFILQVDHKMHVVVEADSPEEARQYIFNQGYFSARVAFRGHGRIEVLEIYSYPPESLEHGEWEKKYRNIKNHQLSATDPKELLAAAQYLIDLAWQQSPMLGLFSKFNEKPKYRFTITDEANQVFVDLITEKLITLTMEHILPGGGGMAKMPLHGTLYESTGEVITSNGYEIKIGTPKSWDEEANDYV